MPSELVYAAAVPEDAEACIALRGQTRENAISAERLRDAGITTESWAQGIRSGTLPGCVCREAGKLLGYCFASVNDGEIVVLALLPEAEHRGIGRALLSRMVDTLAAAGRTRLFLGCSPDPGHRSHGFYRHLGWRSTGRFDRHGDEVLEYHVPLGSDVACRIAVPADALCIAVLGMQVFLDTYATEGIRPSLAHEVLESLSPAAVEALLRSPGHTFIVAELRGHLIGFAQVSEHTGHALVALDGPAELQRLYVQERYTGRGLGARLLREAEALVSSRGATGLWLTAWVGNARARAFYARHGYADVGATPFVFRGETHENRVVVKAALQRA